MSWKQIDNKLVRTFEFNDFKAAIEFVNKVGNVAEEMNHHPDMLLRDYRFVDISMTTHDAGNSITDLDKKLAEKIDAING